MRRVATWLVLFTGLAAAGCRNLDFGTSNELLTDWNNPAVGQMAQRMYLRTHQLSQDSQQRQLLAQVGSRLAGVANRPDYDWNFTLVDDAQPDVIVFPGANVVVTEGLIAACRNEAELAAVLAHELGHLLAGHPMRRPLPVRPGSPEDLRTEPTGNDQQDDIEADSIAMSLLARAGYDPQSFVTFTQNPDDNPERTAFLTAHRRQSPPTSELRVALAQAQQIYRANRQPLGTGIRIVRDESSRGVRQERPESAMAASETNLKEIRWTPSTDRNIARRIDPRGAAKPPGWNTDLVEQGDWLVPVEGEIQQAGFEWNATGETR